MQIKTKGLFPPQREVLQKGLLTKHRHCFLHMATGSGKTYLSEFAIDSVLKEGFKSIYLTPLRALAEQQCQRWKSRFPSSTIGVFTGETIAASATRTAYAKSEILVMTPERLDAILRNWRSHWNWLPDVNLIIVDEFHLMGMPNRGPRLEGALTRLIRLNPFVRIIGLSATIPNADALADWMQGLKYTSSWRQVPLQKSIVRFSSVKDKPLLLLKEIRRCLSSGGQSLVFCNSRSRVQRIADYLLENGIPAAAHHAGLLREKRGSVESDYKSGKLRCLVATSTLEMGLNLPARQVIIFDSYSFNGSGFENLPVWSFIQRAGRAGRPGLDVSGEVVLFLSRGVPGADRYLEGACENVDSRLTDSRALAEQVLIDVHTGLSRTRNELETGFLPLTFFKRQHAAATLAPTINRLLLSGLLDEKEDSLKVTILGRLAVKLMLAPETIQLVRSAITNYQGLKFFDILLLATLSPDCSPVIQSNFEEMDHLVTRISSRPSILLDDSLEHLRRQIPEIPSTLRLLAAIKMSAICLALSDGEEPSSIAEYCDIYEADIRMLSESVVRLLQGISAIASAIDKTTKSEEDATEIRATPGSVPDLCTQLQSMIKYGITPEMIPLTRLAGIGGKTARKLVDAGIETLGDVSQADPEDLVACGIARKKVEALQQEAYGLTVAFDDTLVYTESPPNTTSTSNSSFFFSHSSFDSYRLRRSLELKVLSGDAPLYRVTGGSEPHRVLCRKGTFTCDCADFKKGTTNCKHILAVRRARGDNEILKLVKRIHESKSASIRETLPTLWFGLKFEEDKR